MTIGEDKLLLDIEKSVQFSDALIQTLQSIRSPRCLSDLMEAVSRDLGFRYYALIHHADLRAPSNGKVDIKHYPSAIVDRLIVRGLYRRDPIIRGCIFADSAFIWSELDSIIKLDRRDRESFAIGAREGLNDGITVPYDRLGECSGSCTFAGIADPARIGSLLGMTQMVGIFAFQAARRLVAPRPRIADYPRLHPRPRDCIVLAGRGLSNKEIARALALTPRTVDAYLTEARRLFDAHDRTELVVSAVLAGEVGLSELRRQPLVTARSI